MRALNRIGRGGVWSPTTIGTPTFWFDAYSGITLVSGKVSAWASKVGVYSLANSNSAQRPTYNATGWRSALPCVTFNGATSYNVLKYTIGSSIGAGSWTVAARLKMTSRAATQRITSLTSFANSNDFVYWATISTDKLEFDFASGGGAIGGSVSVVGAAHSVILATNNTNTSQYVDTTIDVNGAAAGGASTYDTLQVGANDVNGTQAAQMDLVELIGWRGTNITAGTALQLQAYLAARWG